MQKQLSKISIPLDLPFSSLNLLRKADGSVEFDSSVIEQICRASDLPPELFINGPEENVCSLIVQWYIAHKESGGADDPVAEDLITEIAIEDRHGQFTSFPPGRA